MNALSKLGIGTAVTAGVGVILAGIPGLIIGGGVFLGAVVAVSLRQ